MRSKSQIAIEFSYRLRKQWPDIWVFWVYCSAAARFEDSFRQIATRVEIPGHDDPKSDILRLVCNWLSDESNGRWLVILDNADDEEVFYGKSTAQNLLGIEQQNVAGNQVPLTSFLPQTPNGRVLVTSRNKSLAAMLILGDDATYEVGLMDEETAIELVQKKVPVTINNRDTCKRLVHALDLLPLAIAQAAGYIRARSPRITIER